MQVLPQSTSAAILNEAKAVKYYVHLNLKKRKTFCGQNTEMAA